MNNLVFNTNGDPLYVYDVDSIQSLSSNGNVFGVTRDGFSLAALTGEYSFEIENPISNTKTLYLTELSVTTRGTSLGLTVSLIRNGTHTPIGSPLSKLNYNFKSTNTSNAIVTYSTNIGTGSEVLLLSYQSVALYTEVFNNSITLPPGTTLLLNLESFVALAQTVSVSFIWCEL